MKWRTESSFISRLSLHILLDVENELLLLLVDIFNSASTKAFAVRSNKRGHLNANSNNAKLHRSVVVWVHLNDTQIVLRLRFDEPPNIVTVCFAVKCLFK